MALRATYKGKLAAEAFIAGVPARDLTEEDWQRLDAPQRERVRRAFIAGTDKPLYIVRTNAEVREQEKGEKGREVDTSSPGDPANRGEVAGVRDGASVNEPGELVPPPNRGERDKPLPELDDLEGTVPAPAADGGES